MELTYGQIAAVLGITWRRLRTTLGHGTAGPDRILATSRAGTRAAAFTLGDAFKLFVLLRIEDHKPLTPKARRLIFDAIPSRDAEFLADGGDSGNEFLLIDGNNATVLTDVPGAAFNSYEGFDADPKIDFSGVVVLIALRHLASEFRRRVQRVLSDLPVVTESDPEEDEDRP